MNGLREAIHEILTGLSPLGKCREYAGFTSADRHMISDAEGLFYGVRAWDETTLAFVVSVLVVAALMASYLPAHRATRVDPMVALRYE
jgi:ABC-type lipoprotein release transport system permease subunit